MPSTWTCSPSWYLGLGTEENIDSDILLGAAYNGELKKAMAKVKEKEGKSGGVCDRCKEPQTSLRDHLIWLDGYGLTLVSVCEPCEKLIEAERAENNRFSPLNEKSEVEYPIHESFETVGELQERARALMSLGFTALVVLDDRGRWVGYSVFKKTSPTLDLDESYVLAIPPGLNGDPQAIY